MLLNIAMLVGHVVLLWFASEFLRNAASGIFFGVADRRLMKELLRSAEGPAQIIFTRRHLAIRAHRAGALVSVPLSVIGGLTIRWLWWERGSFDVAAITVPVVMSASVGIGISARTYWKAVALAADIADRKSARVGRPARRAPTYPNPSGPIDGIDTLANCRRIPAACRVCMKSAELLQSNYYAVDRMGNRIYAAKCCSCGGLNTVYPLPGTDRAVVQSFAEIPPDLRRMMEKGVRRFGFDEGTT